MHLLYHSPRVDERILWAHWANSGPSPICITSNVGGRRVHILTESHIRLILQAISFSSHAEMMGLYLVAFLNCLRPGHHPVGTSWLCKALFNFCLVPHKLFIHGFVDTTIFARIIWIQLHSLLYLEPLLLTRVSWDNVMGRLWRGLRLHLAHGRLLASLRRWMVWLTWTSILLLLLKHLHDDSLRRWRIKLWVWVHCLVLQNMLVIFAFHRCLRVAMHLHLLLPLLKLNQRPKLLLNTSLRMLALFCGHGPTTAPMMVYLLVFVSDSILARPNWLTGHTVRIPWVTTADTFKLHLHLT